MSKLGRERVHREFVKRTHRVFQFLIDDYQFALCEPVESSAQSLSDRDVTVHYSKNQDVAIHLVCEGVSQSVQLQGCREGGRRQRGLRQLMQLRCPSLAIPKGIKEPALTEELEFCAEILRGHFADFLEGDPSILYEPLK